MAISTQLKDSFLLALTCHQLGQFFGGDAGHSSSTGATGGQTIALLPGGLFDATKPSPAQVPGGGGAGQTSSLGAAGLVVINY